MTGYDDYQAAIEEIKDPESIFEARYSNILYALAKALPKTLRAGLPEVILSLSRCVSA